jgi:hypothetical protein
VLVGHPAGEQRNTTETTPPRNRVDVYADANVRAGLSVAAFYIGPSHFGALVLDPCDSFHAEASATRGIELFKHAQTSVRVALGDVPHAYKASWNRAPMITGFQG